MTICLSYGNSRRGMVIHLAVENKAAKIAALLPSFIFNTRGKTIAAVIATAAPAISYNCVG